MDDVRYFELKFLNPLGHIGQIELNSLRVVLDIWISQELVNIGLGVFPVDVQRIGCVLDYFLGEFVLRYLEHLLYTGHWEL